jgi:cytosine deaminase
LIAGGGLAEVPGRQCRQARRQMDEADRKFMDRAIVLALKSAGEGGVPVGAVLAWRGVAVSEGHNRRQQRKVITLHGETDCLTNAGLFGRWRETTLYTTLSPCMMCAGTIVQFGIPRVVVADAENFGGNEDFLKGRGVAVEIMRDEPMIAFFRDWKAKNAEIWNGDIGLG